MAYGDNREQQESDTFDSSIGANWTNGPDLWTACQWATGGYVEPSAAASSCSIVRNTAAHNNDQYSTATVQAAGSGSDLGVILRGGTTITRCYIFYWDGFDPSYNIYDVAEDGGATQVWSTTVGVGTLVAGDTVTGEAQGTTLRLGSDEGSGDTDRSGDQTDNTWGDGEPGVYLKDDTAVENVRITAWAGGNITAGGLVIFQNHYRQQE